MPGVAPKRLRFFATESTKCGNGVTSTNEPLLDCPLDVLGLNVLGCAWLLQPPAVHSHVGLQQFAGLCLGRVAEIFQGRARRQEPAKLHWVVQDRQKPLVLHRWRKPGNCHQCRVFTGNASGTGQ